MHPDRQLGTRLEGLPSLYISAVGLRSDLFESNSSEELLRPGLPEEASRQHLHHARPDRLPADRHAPHNDRHRRHDEHVEHHVPGPPRLEHAHLVFESHYKNGQIPRETPGQWCCVLKQ